MKHKYIIVDDNHESILKTQANAMRFENLAFVGYANNYDDALNLILEQQPSLVFLEINPEKKIAAIRILVFIIIGFTKVVCSF